MTQNAVTDRSLEQLIPGLINWADRVRASGMHDLVGALLDAATPFSALGGQCLYIAQPVLGLFVPRERVGVLAQVLEEPDGLAWLRQIMDL
jgi:hypothetical protein